MWVLLGAVVVDDLVCASRNSPLLHLPGLVYVYSNYNLKKNKAHFGFKNAFLYLNVSTSFFNGTPQVLTPLLTII